MAFVVKKGLGSFASKIESAKNNLKDIKNISMELGNRAKEIAEREYSNSGKILPEISTEYRQDGGCTVRFKHKKIAYVEFGTGIYAKGSYPDENKLPKQPLTFTSPKKSGDIHTTIGWEYYYTPNKKTKRTIGGRAGWFFGNVFSTGNVAGAQIYYTGQTLRREAKGIIKKLYKRR